MNREIGGGDQQPAFVLSEVPVKKIPIEQASIISKIYLSKCIVNRSSRPPFFVWAERYTNDNEQCGTDPNFTISPAITL
jgi:hypothetical protein